MGFSRKNCSPPIEDINGKFQGVKVKVVGIPWGIFEFWNSSKIEEKTWISRESQCKKMENSRGVTVNLTGSPGGQLQKNRYSQQGGYNFFLEKPIRTLIVVFQRKQGSYYTRTFEEAGKAW